MTFAQQSGREPVVVVEIDQDRCSRTYGVAPCAAALGVTGDQKCFNTIISCQDEDNYALGSPTTLRFVTPNEAHGLSRSLVLIPSVMSVTTVPTRINLASGSPDASPLGERGTITIELRDHSYHDRLVDPYYSEREYDPMTQGTFWGKWLARNPYHQGRNIRVKHGYVGQEIGDFTVRYYVIDRIDGPSNGVVTITAKDPLKLLDDDRVKAPAANFGTIASDITEVSGSLSVGTGDGAEYATSGYIRVGGELMQFTRSGDVFTLVDRGLRGTVASTHAAGDLVQEVLVISGVRVDALLQTLMVDYASIDASWVPSSDWDEEADLWCSGFTLSAWITEPTGVGSLVSRICSETGVYVWWDEEEQKVRFRATRPFYPARDVPARELSSDRHIVANSLRIEAQPAERITEVWIYYAMENPIGAEDDPSNFARRLILVDDASEGQFRYGDKRIKRIFCRFLDESNDATATVVGTRILDRRHEVPTIITFRMDAKDGYVNTGDIVRITHPDIADIYGAPLPTYVHITASDPVDPGHVVEYEARPYITRTRYCFIMDDSSSPGPPDYGAANETQREQGGWIAASALGFSNGDLPYKVL